MKKKKMLVAVLLALSNSALGQPTYNHDASVYNQFLVTEVGGGSSQDYREWLEIYNCLQTALKAVRDAYMPLNERKKQYLEIYHDIVLRNQQLVGYVTSLKQGKEANDLLHSKVKPKYARLGSYTTEAYGRWKVSMAAEVINNGNN